MRLLNLGCGANYHPDWMNVDINPVFSDVLPHNLHKPLPFPEGSFDVCYSSHVLEHLRRSEVKFLLKECKRVLKVGGIFRVVVPDLEAIVRNYLSFLEELTSGNIGVESKYDWTMLELLDQCVRSESGGEMTDYLRSVSLEDRKFIRTRIGIEADPFWSEPNRLDNDKISYIDQIKRGFAEATDQIREKTTLSMLRVLGGETAVASYKEGKFRQSGEVHHWMYDRFSISRLLRETGFNRISVVDAYTSQIDGFSKYELDVKNGEVRKPDSLFVEVIR